VVIVVTIGTAAAKLTSDERPSRDLLWSVERGRVVLSLSELLERIRPAGSPGAPAESERSRLERDRARELVEVTDLLAGFERDAAAVVAAARQEADRVVADARRDAHRAMADMSERAAVAGAAIVSAGEREGEAGTRDVRDDAAREVDRIGARADERIPAIVASAIDVILGAGRVEAGGSR
jgi:vacuolar-type H+-ATPase subunit H